jgi:hypothetical protein
VGTWWLKLGRQRENGESPKERVPTTASTSGTVKTAENMCTVAENVDGNTKTLNPAERVPSTANASGMVQTAENWAKTWTETRKL